MEKLFIKNLEEALEATSNSISLSDVFREIDNWNSLTSLAVTSMIDEEYGLTIPRIEFEKLLTVKDLFNYINSKSNKNG